VGISPSSHMGLDFRSSGDWVVANGSELSAQEQDTTSPSTPHGPTRSRFCLSPRPFPRPSPPRRTRRSGASVTVSESDESDESRFSLLSRFSPGVNTSPLSQVHSVGISPSSHMGLDFRSSGDWVVANGSELSAQEQDTTSPSTPHGPTRSPRWGLSSRSFPPLFIVGTDPSSQTQSENSVGILPRPHSLTLSTWVWSAQTQKSGFALSEHRRLPPRSFPRNSRRIRRSFADVSKNNKANTKTIFMVLLIF